MSLIYLEIKFPSKLDSPALRQFFLFRRRTRRKLKAAHGKIRRLPVRQKNRKGKLRMINAYIPAHARSLKMRSARGQIRITTKERPAMRNETSRNTEAAPLPPSCPENPENGKSGFGNFRATGNFARFRVALHVFRAVLRKLRVPIYPRISLENSRHARAPEAE